MQRRKKKKDMFACPLMRKWLVSNLTGDEVRLSDEEWTVFVNAFDKLIQNNNGVVSLAAMNLPADWKEHLSV